MKSVLKSSALRNLPKTERMKKIRSFMACAQPVDSSKRIKELKADIARFEKKYKMTTSQMCKQLCSGKIPNAGDYAAWNSKRAILVAHQANV